jgi:hypothetical protein
MRIGLFPVVFTVAAVVSGGAVATPRVVSLLTGAHSAQLRDPSTSGPRSPVRLTDTKASYALQNEFSRRFLDLPPGDDARKAGAQLQQRDSAAAVGQRWRVRYVGDGSFMTLLNDRSGMMLAVGRQSPDDGAPLVQAPPNPDDGTEQWALEDAGEGTVWVVNRDTGKVLDIAGDDIDTSSGAPVQQWQRQTGARDQRWRVVRQP